MSSEIKLEVAEIVAASQAGRVLALTPEGVPVWVDITTLQKQTFQNWLNENSDIVGYWWPDKSPASVINKASRLAVDFNSYAGAMLDVDGVRLYSSKYVSGESLRFMGNQSDQISMDVSEVGIFYFDDTAPESSMGDEMRIFANNSSNNSCGFRIYRNSNEPNSSNGYIFFAHAYIDQTVKSISGPLDGVVRGWNYFHISVAVDSESMTAEFICKINGLTVGSKIEGFSNNRVSTYINSGYVDIYALDNFYPAFYAKSRRALTDVEALEIFEKFKAEYGIV